MDFNEKIRQTLERCKTDRDMVEVYDDERNLDRFNVGLVESVTRESFCILSIGPHGDFDGRQVGRIEDIIRLSTGSEYLGALKLLHEAKHRLEQETLPEPEGYMPMDLQNSLRFAKDKRIVVSLVDPDHLQITGFVQDYGEDFVEICELRRDGQEDGSIVVHLEEIVRVDIGGRMEQARAFVHRVRMGL
jgi:hypothetical protein